MRISHKEKTKIAKKMLTPTERRNNTPIFESKAWIKRKLAREKKQIKEK